MTYHTSITPETSPQTQHTLDAGTAETSEGDGPNAAGPEIGMVVDWEVRMARRLEAVGLDPAVSNAVDVVVVDRRGCETTPCEPGVLTLDGCRVLVVPDRRDGAPTLEVWVDGTGDRFRDVVRTLRRTVTLDAGVEDAFDSASGARRTDRDDVPTDGGRSATPVDPLLEAFEEFDGPRTALAIGGFAGAVEPLDPSG
jgi:hypothetical protein